MSTVTKIRIRCPQTRKRCFGTEEAANAALSRIWAPGARDEGTGAGKTPTRAYLCEHCGVWHLTAQPEAWR